MARALTGYGELHGFAEHMSRRVPRTHPEKMALAAGVLLDINRRDHENSEPESGPALTTRKLGTKALETTSA